MGDAPRFSVVVPAYNAARTVGSSIESVLTQTVDDFEVIVVDDGSTDDTAARVREHRDPRVRLVQQENRGLPGARNAGIAVARGRLVSFLDSDDIWMPTYLQRMGDALEARADAGLAYCDVWVFEDGTGRIRRQSFFDRNHPGTPVPEDPAEFFLVHLRNNFFYVGTTVRREVLDQVGLFREDMTSLEDYELWLRIEASGFGAVEVPERLALYRSSPGQMSRNAARMAQNLILLCDILDERDDLSPAARAIVAQRRAAARRAYLAASEPLSRPAIQRRARLQLGRVYRLLPGREIWTSTCPPEVASLYPDLAAR